MKKLISVISILAIVSFYSSGMNSLKELATQEFIKQIFDYPSLSPEEKVKFNNHPQPGEALSFKGQNLDFLNISGIKLWGTNFKGVTLNGTNFFKADLTGCNFKGAILKNVNFQEAILINTDFTGAHFKDVKLQGAKLTETLTLPYYSETVEILKLYSDLQNEEDKKVLNNLIGTGVFDFKNQTIQGLNLREINFKNCNFNDSRIINCDLTDAQVGDGLAYASFSDVKLSDTFILKGKVDLYGLYEDPTLPQDHKNTLAKILLTKVNLSGTILFDDFIIPPYKDHKDLVKRYVDFPAERENLNKLFDIISLNLSYDDLRNLDLQGMNLSKANLEGAQLQGAILFKGFKVPSYDLKRYSFVICLLNLYGHSKDLQERKNLNKFFNIYPFYTGTADLKNLDLERINFSKANLMGVQLQGSTLFKGFKIPSYESFIDLVKRYSDFPKERENLNKLFNIISLDLPSADLRNLDLQGINFSKANLRSAKLQGSILFEGFKVPEYSSALEVVILYSKYKDAKFRRNLNRLFDLIKLDLESIKLNDLDLAGINLINSNCRYTDFSGCNLTSSVYKIELLKRAILNKIQWSEDFVFPSGLSEKELEEMYPQIAKTERQKYFFKQACRLMDYKKLYEKLNVLDRK